MSVIICHISYIVQFYLLINIKSYDVIVWAYKDFLRSPCVRNVRVSWRCLH